MSGPKPSLVWFRRDFRLTDNPALRAAADRGGPVVPVFVWSPGEDGDWPIGAASKVYLHHALLALAEALEKAGSPLVIRVGDSAAGELARVARAVGAESICYNRLYEPQMIAQSAAVKEALRDEGVEVKGFDGNILMPPWELKTGAGTPYSVYTPYWKSMRKAACIPEPLPAVGKLGKSSKSPASKTVEDLDLLPSIPWDESILAYWKPYIGEKNAWSQFERYLSGDAAEYSDLRNLPARDATSHMSPALHWGEVSPRQLFHAIEEKKKGTTSDSIRKSYETYQSEIAWRDFSAYVMFHFPHTSTDPLKPEFDAFPWNEVTEENFGRWRRGQTGYPIVDAAMRQLWAIGWMHNRCRMIVASFLCKDLRLHWIEGAKWFYDTLVDADLCSNNMGWQWSAGCGADAQPFFRIFNPIGQGEKFDPDGAYIKQWCPELSNVPPKFIHKPWEMNRGELELCGVLLGRDYPEPMVDHKTERQKALDGYEKVKEAKR
ncbi:MAG: deoxyribodipyrimidine photo-lyase [Sumerlaeia bacterium]